MNHVSVQNDLITITHQKTDPSPPNHLTRLRDEDARSRPKTAQNASKCEHECSKQRRDEDSPGRVELEPLDELEVEDMLDDSESDPPFPGDRFSDNEDVT